jgi:hypothetical protein
LYSQEPESGEHLNQIGASVGRSEEEQVAVAGAKHLQGLAPLEEQMMEQLEDVLA